MKNDQYQCLWWQLAAYIAKNDSGSFGCVVTSKQCSAELGRIGCNLGVLATSTFVMSDGFKIIFGSFQIMKQFSY